MSKYQTLDQTNAPRPKRRERVYSGDFKRRVKRAFAFDQFLYNKLDQDDASSNVGRAMRLQIPISNTTIAALLNDGKANELLKLARQGIKRERLYTEWQGILSRRAEQMSQEKRQELSGPHPKPMPGPTM